MEYQLQTEAVLRDGRKIKYVNAPFDAALSLIQQKNGRLITSQELAKARMQFPREHSLNTNGSYTRAGYAYKKGELPIRAALSPLIENSDLAKLAVEANRSGRYFLIEDTKLYDGLREKAEQDKKRKITPVKRRAFILPSREKFYVSPDENSDVFEAIFGKNGDKYLKFLGLERITVHPVPASEVDKFSGSTLTQEWLRVLGTRSHVVGHDTCLDSYDRVRGVFPKTGFTSSKRI